jgi:hypothetical protein
VARAAQDQELVFQQNVLSHEGLGSSGPKEFAHCAQQVNKDEDVPHRRSLVSVIILGKPARSPFNRSF